MAKTTSSVQYLGQKPEFGSRFLTEDQDVWTQNAWDHVPAPDDQDEIIAASLLRQRTNPVPDNDKQKYNDRPARHWDIFYKNNTANFFKNRKWLHQEFRELTEATEPTAGPVSIVEVGCGVGNSVFPLLSANSNPQLSLRAFDYSNRAIKLLQENPLYTSPPVGAIQAAVWDLTSPTLPDDLSPSSADIVIMVFVFSALHPAEWAQAVANVHRILKPGGIVLFRDYGRYDLTQLRLKDRRLLDNNFYIRGDNTRVYFFELDELALLFTGSRAGHVEAAPVVTEVVNDELNDSPDASGASTPLDAAELEELPLREQQIHPTLLASPPPCLFSTEQLGVDRRLLVNRKRQLKMYRVWMQAKFRKLERPDS
ncbi:Methyltransferase-like protein [Mycena kentingensis (nom. inval.)]|nr:Methyltransferase-like protein [Mycena kentingensis (nom. inval.)]